MDAEDITSPKPVFPGGSAVTSAIPLLDNDSGATAPPTVALPEVAVPDVLPVAAEGLDEEGPDTEVVDSVSTATAPVTVLEDSVVEPADTLPTTTEATDASNETAAQIEPLDVPTGQLASDGSDPTATGIAPAQQATPLGLPSGVDLQALLNSFANANPAPATPSAPQGVASDPPTAQAAPSQAQPTPSQPSVPWQTAQPSPAPDLSVPPNAPTMPSDDAAYEQFLVDEKRIMGNTAPHEFEPGSRLFVGNLSNDSTSKRQIFMIFKKYGKLAQIAMKSTYGFVQYLSARECRAAMESEQGTELGNRKLHLEISKPQQPRGVPAVFSGANSSRRRSRSPSRRSRGHGGRGDAYGQEQAYGRSPPPRRGSPGRFHNPYEPMGANAYPVARRSPSPRRYAPPQAEEYPLPPRYGAQVPEAQIVVLDDADRTYIYWVETSLRQAGLRVETLFLSPRLGLPAVVRQMAKEGVLAIVQCDRQGQMVNKVSLQVFDRSAGANNVRFDEYAGLDMQTAVGLLKRSQQQQQVLAALPLPSVAGPGPSPGQPGQANLAAMIAQMDPASLQQVIGALSQQQGPQQHQQQQPNPGYQPGAYPYRR